LPSWFVTFINFYFYIQCFSKHRLRRRTIGGSGRSFFLFFKNNVQFQFCSIRYHYFSWRMKNCFKGKPDQLSMLKHNFWRIKKGKIIWISEVIKMYSFCHSVKLFCLLKLASDQTFFVKTQLSWTLTIFSNYI